VTGPGPTRGHRLDPDRAGAGKTTPPSPRDAPPRDPPAPALDTRRYRWMIGIFGLALVVAISIYEFASHGVGTAGIPAGQKLHFFAAPLAASTLNGDANLDPPCTVAQHDPRALNICLLAGRGPLVLAFFVTGSAECKREVDTLQRVSREFPPGEVQFAAVAVRGSHATTAHDVRAHHWTIPVAYDADGAVGQAYGVEICPLLELARPGGIVANRLVGTHWLSGPALAAQVRALVRG
jgi:peroxiredoxin